MRAHHEHWSKKRFLAAIDAFVLRHNEPNGENPTDIPAKMRQAFLDGKIREY